MFNVNWTGWLGSSFELSKCSLLPHIGDEKLILVLILPNFVACGLAAFCLWTKNKNNNGQSSHNVDDNDDNKRDHEMPQLPQLALVMSFVWTLVISYMLPPQNPLASSSSSLNFSFSFELNLRLLGKFAWMWREHFSVCKTPQKCQKAEPMQLARVVWTDSHVKWNIVTKPPSVLWFLNYNSACETPFSRSTLEGAKSVQLFAERLKRA